MLLARTWIVAGQNIDKDYRDGEVYVKLKDEIPFKFDTAQAEIDIDSKLPFLAAFISKYEISKVRSPFYFAKSDKLKRTFRIYFGSVARADEFVAELQNSSLVEYAEKVPERRIVYTPNDLLPNTYGPTGSYASGQWGLYDVSAQSAWDIARGSAIVAIVDNAVDITHQDLKGIVSSSWDVTTNSSNPGPPVDSFARDSEWGHGTHTSGTACAQTNNGTGIASIGFGCKLMAVKTTFDTSPGDEIDDGDAGITWAYSHGANVISCSWGGGAYSTTEQNIINAAYADNVVVVCAAGNSNTNTLFYPAAYTHVVSVAAVDSGDVKAWFSNYGTWVTVSSPGVNIESTLPGNTYGSWAGTSMATPLVAGLCGLIKSVNPSLTYDQVVSYLVNNTDNINTINPAYSGLLGSGRINAFKAVSAALPCNGTVDLGTGVYSTLVTESSQTITSENTIPDTATVTLTAATLVHLKTGFVANTGCTFKAYNGSCGGTLRSEEVANQTTGIESPADASSNDIQIIPNPFNTSFQLSVTVSQDEKASIIIYNTIGAQVKEIGAQQLTAGNNNIAIDLSQFASGVYLVEIKAGNARTVKKVVKN
jgi:subtilisin family serine protease